MNKNKSLIVLFLIVILSVVLRFSYLGSQPPGLTNDEADIGYDAFSILKTGKDQWVNIYPLTAFKGFGDFRLPVYTYLVFPSIAVFGVNEFAVRFPSAFIGVLTVVLVYFLGKKLISHRAGIISSFLLTISPWHIAMSRVGIESNIAVFGVMLTVMTFILMLQKVKYKYIFLFATSFILTFYSYYSIRVILPVLIFCCLFLFNNNLKDSARRISVAFIIILLFIIPGLLSQQRLSQISLTKDMGLIDSLNEQRGACQENIPKLICQISHNRPLTYLNKYVSNYLNHFSISLLFLKGADNGLSAMYQRGFFYLMELLLLVAGLWILANNKSKENKLLLLWFLAAPIADSVTGDGHYSRMLTFIPVIQIIEAVGLIYLFDKFKNKVPGVLVIVILLFSLGGFLINYYTYYPKYFSRSSHYGYQQLFTYLKTQKSSFKDIYVSNSFYDTKQYIFYLFFNQYDPETYQNNLSNKVTTDQDGWIWVDKIDNIHFISTVSEIKKLNPNSLVVANPYDLPKNIIPNKIFYDLKGDALFYLITSENLMEYMKKIPRDQNTPI